MYYQDRERGTEMTMSEAGEMISELRAAGWRFTELHLPCVTRPSYLMFGFNEHSKAEIQISGRTLEDWGNDLGVFWEGQHGKVGVA